MPQRRHRSTAEVHMARHAVRRWRVAHFWLQTHQLGVLPRLRMIMADERDENAYDLSLHSRQLYRQKVRPSSPFHI